MAQNGRASGSLADNAAVPNPWALEQPSKKQVKQKWMKMAIPIYSLVQKRCKWKERKKEEERKTKWLYECMKRFKMFSYPYERMCNSIKAT
jgi:hypothetical protein